MIPVWSEKVKLENMPFLSLMSIDNFDGNTLTNNLQSMLLITCMCQLDIEIKLHFFTLCIKFATYILYVLIYLLRWRHKTNTLGKMVGENFWWLVIDKTVWDDMYCTCLRQNNDSTTIILLWSCFFILPQKMGWYNFGQFLWDKNNDGWIWLHNLHRHSEQGPC